MICLGRAGHHPVGAPEPAQSAPVAREAALQQDGGQRRQQDRRPAQGVQRARGTVSQQDDQGGYQGVPHQDVTLPEQVVKGADPQQEQVAPQAQQGRAPDLGDGPVAEQGDPGAEQHREEAHELLVDEHLPRSHRSASRATCGNHRRTGCSRDPGPARKRRRSSPGFPAAPRPLIRSRCVLRSPGPTGRAGSAPLRESDITADGAAGRPALRGPPSGDGAGGSAPRPLPDPGGGPPAVLFRAGRPPGPPAPGSAPRSRPLRSGLEAS